MENSALPYPPILTYQYNNGMCNAGKDDPTSICEGYTNIYNNGNSASNCGSTHSLPPQYSPSPNCLFDVYADTCAGNKLYSVAKKAHKQNFNNKSNSIGINSYLGIGSSHIAYPSITDNCYNYSIYKWLLDISFIDNLNCIMCAPKGECPLDMLCTEPNSRDKQKCCS